MNAGSGRIGLDIRSTKQNASRISHGEWLTDDNGLRYVSQRERIPPIAGFTKFGPYQTFTTSDSAVSTGGVAHWMDAAAFVGADS
jgi:hypothetical protein